MLRRYARWSAEGGQGKFKAMTNNEVWIKLGLVPTALEIKVQKLRWLQAMVRHPDAHAQVLGALFAQLRRERTPTLDDEGRLAAGANPWAVSFF